MDGDPSNERGTGGPVDGDRPPASVLLPTVHPTPVVDEIAGQLRDGDELLVCCDRADDPVAEQVGAFATDEDGSDRVTKEGGSSPTTRGDVRLVVAGDPEGCSGKANAVAAGMAAARNDRIVWTDDDFDHPPDWLAGLLASYERQGPTTEYPFFEGRDPLAVLLEPVYVVTGTVPTYVGGVAWAGSLIFDRSDLDEAAFVRDLRRSVSDDGVLTDHVDLSPGGRTRRVPAGGSVRATLERHVRFSQIFRFHAPIASVAVAVGSTLLAAALLLFPLPGLLLTTASAALGYAFFGVRRWTFLLAYPAFLAQVPLGVYALARRTFVWGGRRYRWRGKYDVEVLEDVE